MKKLKSNLLQVNHSETDYEIRVEEIRGDVYWVLPVVMMVEGVHHGNRGPLLYTQEQLAASASFWNGMPVTIGHPQDEKGRYISANSPGVFHEIVGRVYNPKMKGAKLTAEVWIDVNALTLVSTEAIEYIKEKKALDVSIGVFSEEVGEQGEHNGEVYRAEAINLGPDHLALLPGVDGACSWNDGCGIRNNSKMKMKINNSQNTKLDKSAWLAALIEQGFGIHITNNDASYSQIMQSVQEQLNSLDSDIRVYYLEEIFDNYFVYCTVNRETRERTLYKRNYSVKQDGKVQFQGDPVEVRKEVSFINMSKHTRTNFKSKTESNMKTNGKKCECTVDSLIQNQATNFTEDDREWLAELAPEQLEKLAPKAPKATETTANKAEAKKEETPTEVESGVTVNEDGALSINGKTLDQHIKESLAKEGDPIKFIDNFMPDGLKDQMKSGLKMYQSRREKMIKDIVGNSKFKEAQLKTWSDEDLGTLHASLVNEDADSKGGNYTPLAGGSLEEGEDSEEGSEDEISAMMSFSTVKEKVEKETSKKK